MELVISNGSKPENVAIAALVYSALTFVAMALYGVEAWIERGEAFSVYFNLFSRISLFERRGREIGLRKPLSGPAAARAAARARSPLLAVMIGSVTFDGAAEAPLWTNIAPRPLRLLPVDRRGARARARGGVLRRPASASVLIIYGFFWLGSVGARSVGGGFSSQPARRRVRPHACSDRARLRVRALPDAAADPGPGDLASKLGCSDPLGNGSDIFGTADHAINFNVISSNETWYCQVAFVVLGHVAALTLAHDRALALYDKAKLAVRSQYWMLGVMIGFTSLALWLLSQANQLIVLAHAGHWLVNLSFCAARSGFIGWLGWITIKDRRRGGKSIQRRPLGRARPSGLRREGRHCHRRELSR